MEVSGISLVLALLKYYISKLCLSHTSQNSWIVFMGTVVLVKTVQGLLRLEDVVMVVVKATE